MKLEPEKFYQTKSKDKAFILEDKGERFLVYHYGLGVEVYYSKDGKIQDSRYAHIEGGELVGLWAERKEGVFYIAVCHRDGEIGVSVQPSEDKARAVEGVIAVKQLKWVEGENI